MKKLLAVALLAILVAPILSAGERPPLDVFRTAERCFELTDEQREAIREVNRARSEELRERMREIEKELDKKYAELVGEALPPKDREKYKLLLAAQGERDGLIQAADKELQDGVAAIFAKHKLESIPGRNLPPEKDDIVHSYLKLGAEERKVVDELRRLREEEWRKESRAIQRPKDWRDREARDKYGKQMREARELVEADALQAMMTVLNETQTTACEAVFKAIDARDKKAADAVKACDAKVTEQVGKDMMNRLNEMRRGGGRGQ